MEGFKLFFAVLFVVAVFATRENSAKKLKCYPVTTTEAPTEPPTEAVTLDPSSTVCDVKFRDYLNNNDPKTNGFKVGSYDNGADVYVGTAFVAIWGENQPIGIAPPNPSKSILFENDVNNVVDATGTRYFVPDENCDCNWIPSSNGTWEKGIVPIVQPGWVHFIGAIYNQDGSLRCTGPVSSDWFIMTCIDRDESVVKFNDYHVLVCNPKDESCEKN